MLFVVHNVEIILQQAQKTWVQNVFFRKHFCGVVAYSLSIKKKHRQQHPINMGLCLLRFCEQLLHRSSHSSCYCIPTPPPPPPPGSGVVVVERLERSLQFLFSRVERRSSSCFTWFLSILLISCRNYHLT